ncbi:hypothetical protein AMJ80_12750 [bacterium SM23_31]|nr:MAG: hypothetical protein AMJ80_12750 [bacterium SM23_31]
MPRHKDFLSPFEWEIMNVIWDLGGSPTVKNVIDVAYPDGSKAYTTVLTIMSNLVDKGFLKKEKFGPINIYKPLKNREEAVSKEANIFMNKVFGGSFKEMAHFMLDNSKLSDTEFSELKKLIQQRESKQKGKK